MGILLVDDSQDNLTLLKHILANAGYKDTIVAESAAEAFVVLGLNGPAGSPVEIDLILMDIVMPGLDGIEACRRIKASERFEEIPVIMVTSSAEVADLQKAFAVGAVDYILKPFNKIELVTRVRSVLRLKQEMDRRKARERELVEVTRQLEAANEVLRKISSKDGLTGIANRRYLDEYLAQEWRRALRESFPVSVVMIDIDFFKLFNDTYGHQAGDECLKKVTSTLNSQLKRPGDLVARFGGEEFIAVLPDTGLEGAVKLAELMRSSVAGLNLEHNGSTVASHVTISLGVSSIIPYPGGLADELVSLADRALYKAKEDGRNRVVVSEERTSD